MPVRGHTGQRPPVLFQLAGHSVRWRLLRELAQSDCRVRELTASLGEPQSLVSYHLHKLRTAQLVSARRSSFDARDSYYSVDLERCRGLLVDAGAAIHPALQLDRPRSTERRRRSRPVRVLFLCTGNSSRSQIAEALLNELANGAAQAFSAGTRPKPVHPNAIRAMRERGLDISDRRPKHLSTFGRRRFDYVISLCDRVREVCPEFPGEPQTLHWSIADPAAEPGSEAETYPAFERAAAELETRIDFLLARISEISPTKEVSQP